MTALTINKVLESAKNLTQDEIFKEIKATLEKEFDEIKINPVKNEDTKL